MISFKNKNLKLALEERLVFDVALGATVDAAADAAPAPAAEAGDGSKQAAYDKTINPEKLEHKEKVRENTDDVKVQIKNVERPKKDQQIISINIQIKQARKSDIDFMKLDINTQDYQDIKFKVKTVKGVEAPTPEISTEAISLDTDNVRNINIRLVTKISTDLSDLRLRLDSQNITATDSQDIFSNGLPETVEPQTTSQTTSSAFIGDFNPTAATVKEFDIKSNGVIQFKPAPLVTIIESPEQLIQETRESRFGVEQANTSLTTEDTSFELKKVKEAVENDDQADEEIVSENEERGNEFYNHMSKNLEDTAVPKSISVISNDASNYDVGVNISLSQDYNPQAVQNIVFSNDGLGNSQFEAIPFEQFIIGTNNDSMADELSLGLSENVSKSSGLYNQLDSERTFKQNEASDLASFFVQ